MTESESTERSLGRSYNRSIEQPQTQDGYGELDTKIAQLSIQNDARYASGLGRSEQVETRPQPNTSEKSGQPYSSSPQTANRTSTAKISRPLPTNSSGNSYQNEKKAQGFCIQAPVTLPALWYSHPELPGLNLCSNCYDSHIKNSGLEAFFQGRYLDDGQAHSCDFSSPRLNHERGLFAIAKKERDTQKIVQFLKLRRYIPNCKGVAGAKGSEGISWYNAKNNAIPGLVICQSCWEDHALVWSNFSSHFEPASLAQDQEAVWACDFAIPFILNKYHKAAEENDWAGFVKEAAVRLQLPPCPGTAEQQTSTPSAQDYPWYCLPDVPEILLCISCFCDHTVEFENGNWVDSSTNTRVQYNQVKKCVLGRFDLSIAMTFAKRHKSLTMFEDAIRAFNKQPECNSKGMTGATWYTLASDPRDLGVCGACYGTILNSMDMERFFIPKSVPADMIYLCVFNPAFPRFVKYVEELELSWYKNDISNFERFVTDYASLPVCRGAKDFKNGKWYGWSDCNICPECFHEYIRGTKLADSMPYQGVIREESCMCELYSPRMRQLYENACSKSPPDVSELLVFSNQRRRVYSQTVMVIERIEREQRLALGRQIYLNQQSSFYTFLGNSVASTMGSTHTYSAPGIGYGFQNQYQLDGARYGRQAQQAGSQVQNPSANMSIGELESIWKKRRMNTPELGWEQYSIQ